eukprot:TRINITY_DN5113_c0_g4_i2.p1 TRINITY_DN5113_c0_g4~~TRINITY_DN5113_c0_g4_i2.p1  ORF type:complete len:881 (-),score=363.88 TRINITY_DN5113_c0_g4_i2:81-2723(-)
MEASKMSGKSFDNLLQSAEQLIPASEGFVIHRNVQDLEEASRQLVSRSTRGISDSSKSKASYLLLAAKGFDADRLPRELQSLRQLRPASAAASSAASVDGQQAAPEQQQQQAAGGVGGALLVGASGLDVDSYVRQTHDVLLLGAIDDAKRHTAARLEARASEALERDWSESRRRLLQQLTLAPSPLLAASLDHRQADGAADEVTGSSGWRGPSGRQTHKQLLFAKAVDALVSRSSLATPAAIASTFAEAAAHADQAPALRTQQADLWALLAAMVDVATLPNNNGSKAAAAGNSNSSSVPIESAAEQQQHRQQDVLVLAARRFLEQQWRRWLEHSVEHNPAQAQLGPRPSIRSFVQAFVRLKLGSSPPAEYEVIESAEHGRRAVWAELWALLRCGAHNEARQVARELPGSVASGVSALLDDFLQAELPAAAARDVRARSEALAVSRDGVGLGQGGDPYKQAVNALLTGQPLDAARLSSIVQQTTQDFLWVRLSGLARSAGGASQGLGRLQQLVKRYGAGHFARHGRQPLLYAAVLLATLQFADAVDYLASASAELRVDAVHIAVALGAAGLLPPGSVVGLVGPYVDEFAAEAADDALAYWLLLARLLPDEWARASAGLARALLCKPELFSRLSPVASPPAAGLSAGSTAASGGLLSEARARDVALAAAREADALGRPRDALALYERIEEWRAAVQVLEAEVCARLVPGSAPDADRTFWLQRAERLVQRAPWGQQGDPEMALAVASVHCLLRVAYFFELVRAARHLDALQVLQPLALVPFEPSQALACAERFAQLPAAVQQAVPAVLEASADALRRLVAAVAPAHQFASIGRSLATDAARHQRVEQLRQTSAALVTFVGLLHPRMPNSVVYVIKSLEMELQL